MFFLARSYSTSMIHQWKEIEANFSFKLCFHERLLHQQKYRIFSAVNRYILFRVARVKQEKCKRELFSAHHRRKS